MTSTSVTSNISLDSTAVDRGRFVWHELMAKDTAAAAEFYTKVVGWTTSKWDGPVAADYTMFMAGEKAIGGLMKLTAEAEAMGARPSWLAYVSVADCDATVEQVVQLGGEVVVPAMSMDQVGRFAILKDPQGAVFAVLQPGMPSQPETDPAVREFSWHELNTSDLNGAIEFYQKIFGWEKKSEFDMGDKGVYHMYGRDRFTYGGMMTKPEGMNMPSNWVHYVSVESADAATERATNGGGSVMLGPMDVPGGDRITILTDPEGAVFAVHSKAPK